MAVPPGTRRPSDVQPSIYRIRVEGSIDETWAGRLDGMTITTCEVDGGKPVTTLVGPARDQAELFGLLNTLYELHMRVLSVELEDAG